MGDASQGKTRVLGSFLTIYMDQIEINGAGGSVTVVANPWVRRFPVSGVRCPMSVGRDRWHRAWPAIDGTVRGPPLKRRCARALRRSVRGAIAVSDRSNVALRGLCCDFGQNSSEPRCGRSLRPIVFSTLVSYRAGRCLRT